MFLAFFEGRMIGKGDEECHHAGDFTRKPPRACSIDTVIQSLLQHCSVSCLGFRERNEGSDALHEAFSGHK